jgi:hypothetical protein
MVTGMRAAGARWCLRGLRLDAAENHRPGSKTIAS